MRKSEQKKNKKNYRTKLKRNCRHHGLVQPKALNTKTSYGVLVGPGLKV